MKLQTPLMQACRSGHWEVVQTLLAFRCNVWKADGLTDRMAANCNGWLAVDVARMWKCNWLEHVLAPKSQLPVPKFPPSAYLSLPLPSLLAVARDYAAAGFPASPDSGAGNDDDACSVCLERPCNVAAEVCGHELCLKCAMDLCTVMKAYEVPGLAGTVPCPLCRSGIASFRKAVAAATASPEDDQQSMSGSSLPCACARCQDRHGSPEDDEEEKSTCRSSGGRSYGGGGLDGPEAAIAPLYCAPFTGPSAILS